MSEWIGLLGALAGAGVAGYGTFRISRLQHQHEIRQDYQRKFLTACETIYELLSNEAGLANEMSMLIIGDLGHGVQFDASKIQQKSQLTKLKMLVGFYVPELRSDVEEIQAKFLVVVQAVGEVLFQKNRTEDWKGNTVSSAALSAAELTRLVSTMQERLADIANKRIAPGIPT